MKRKKEIKRFKERKKKKGICEIISVYIVERKKKRVVTEYCQKIRLSRVLLGIAKVLVQLMLLKCITEKTFI